MKALVYHGPGQRGWDSVEDPRLIDPTDIIVRVDTTTICGTDLHILRVTCRRRPRARSSVTRPWDGSRRSAPASAQSRPVIAC